MPVAEKPPEPEPQQGQRRKIKPIEAVQMFSDQLTLTEANAQKDRQRILDQIFGLVGQFSNLNESQVASIKLLKAELDRLKKLCKAHGIDPTPPKPEKPKPQNRKERRAEARKEKKAIKKQAKKKKK